jgi:hypothetical protein
MDLSKIVRSTLRPLTREIKLEVDYKQAPELRDINMEQWIKYRHTPEIQEIKLEFPMNEQEWLTSEDPANMVKFLDERGSLSNYRQPLWRQLRLVACAACHLMMENLKDGDGHHLLNTFPGTEFHNTINWGEAFADGKELDVTIEAIGENFNKLVDRDAPGPFWVPWLCIKRCLGNRTWTGRYVAEEVVRLCLTSEGQSDIIRDVIGNPFLGYWKYDGSDEDWDYISGPDLRKPAIAYDQRWSTKDVLSIANGIYQEKDFSSCFILADALEDADKDQEVCGACEGTGRVMTGDLFMPCKCCGQTGRKLGYFLNHLRSPRKHVKGCHVLDIILNKR